MSQVSVRVRTACVERDEGKCLRCVGGRPASQLHHRRPRGMGSSSRPETNESANLVSLCSPCHTEVESERAQSLLDGWLLTQGQSPSATPLNTPRGTFLLDNIGGMTQLVR